MPAPAIGVQRRRSPGPTAQVDWSHPLSVALFDCWIASAHPTNLAHGVGATVTSNPDHGATTLGEARVGASGASVNLPSRGLSFSHDGTASRPCTMRLIFTPITWPNAFTALVERGAASSNRDFSVFVGTGGNTSYFVAGKTSTTPRVWGNGIGGENMTVGQTWDLVITFDGNIAATSYVNGRRTGGVNANTALGTAPSSSDWTMGRNVSSGGANANARYHALMAWTRELSAAEIAALHADPYCFLRY